MIQKASPILPLLLLAGCAAGLAQPSPHAPGNDAGSYAVAFDPAQSPGRMVIEEAEDLLKGSEKAFTSTLWGTRNSTLRVSGNEIHWGFVMGKGQGFANILTFPFPRFDPRVREYPKGTVFGAPFKINTGTDVTAVNTDEVFANSGLVPFMLNFQTLEEARPLAEALRLFQLRAAGQPVPEVRDRGAEALAAGRTEEARADAVLYLKHNLRPAAAFEGEDPLGAVNLAERKAATADATAKAAAAEKAGDLPAAFREYRRAYGRSCEIAEATALIGHLFRLYPKLRAKPEISEACRRQVVKGQALMDAKRYVEASDAFALAPQADPWFPDIYFNQALLLGDAPPGVWDKSAVQGAIQCMKRYLELAPDAPDARTARDKIYAWEALEGK